MLAVFRVFRLKVHVYTLLRKEWLKYAEFSINEVLPLLNSILLLTQKELSVPRDIFVAMKYPQSSAVYNILDC